jgi:hypothetical protein
VLIGAAISAIGEFAPTTGRFSISPQTSRRLVLLGVLVTIGAGLRDNQESERAATELADNVQINLQLTQKTLASATSSVARQEEMMKTITGANSIFYLHPEADAVGDLMMYSRFVGEYPLPHVYFEIRDFSGLGVGFMDAHKTSVGYRKSLNHVYKDALWHDNFPRVINPQDGFVRIDYDEGHRAFRQFIYQYNDAFCYKIFEKTPHGLVHLAEYDHADPGLPRESVKFFEEEVGIVPGQRSMTQENAIDPDKLPAAQ